MVTKKKAWGNRNHQSDQKAPVLNNFFKSLDSTIRDKTEVSNCVLQFQNFATVFQNFSGTFSKIVHMMMEVFVIPT